MAEIQSIKRRFGIIGDAPALNYALSVAERVAPTELTVLITGESGVGKEVFSQIIHQYSPRKHNAFIAVNCGAIPEGTIDSELFGHEKGAFTGASEKRKGYFETVDGGTIFLDEIGEMPLGTQARLLRVLESGEFIKVGSSKVQKTDVRVIAATNVNLLESVKKGKFREDLYYRLNTVPIEIPPLRERGDDVLLLFRKFASDIAERHRSQPVRLDESAQMLIRKYDWPGNIRQLKNVAEQISVLAVDQMITADDLKRALPDMSASRLPAVYEGKNGSAENDYTERELLYKMLFDIKKDVYDLKQFIYDITGSEEIPRFDKPKEQNLSDQQMRYLEERRENLEEYKEEQHEHHSQQPVILHKEDEHYHEAETVEESLSIADKEKELIIKALAKHSGKRKSAAQDLGISERTLYRKIKEYNIQE